MPSIPILGRLVTRQNQGDVFCVDADESRGNCDEYRAVTNAAVPAWVIIVPVVVALSLLGLLIAFSVRFRRRCRRMNSIQGTNEMSSQPVYMEYWAGRTGDDGQKQAQPQHDSYGPPPIYEHANGNKSGFQRLDS